MKPSVWEERRSVRDCLVLLMRIDDPISLTGITLILFFPLSLCFSYVFVF